MSSMKNNILKKIDVVSLAENLISNNEMVVVVDFTKVKSIDLKEIRVKLFQNNFRINVIKNSLFKRALLKSPHSEVILRSLSGQNLFVFGNDIGILIKILKSINKINPNFKMILAYSYGKLFSGESILSLLDVKNKLGEVLVFISVLRFLLLKLLQALKYNNFKLLFLLKLIKINKENG